VQRRVANNTTSYTQFESRMSALSMIALLLMPRAAFADFPRPSVCRSGFLTGFGMRRQRVRREDGAAGLDAGTRPAATVASGLCQTSSPPRASLAELADTVARRLEAVLSRIVSSLTYDSAHHDGPRQWG
jgi:hypothetical protein